MNLRYRGVDYQPNQSNLETTEEVIGRYRGAVVTRRVTNQGAKTHPQGLKYRGVDIH
ncbi:DUF4278 domain-containing protein [Leptolyngbya sp. PCC 6406]|uniref:DUF4278 domain-containing protein n=1 Tax=Leptolyngbya sp. PCC 6406 TaxID=1173264 RepID=UPI0002ABD164|nr:DUF4278 domain-containing protein [Leptolyngbya sp. PCC 6406]